MKIDMCLKINCLVLILIAFLSCQQKEKTEANFKTICNPLDLNYRFQLDEPSRREAADPTVVLYHDEYYLFASKSGGYWYSSDLTEWSFVHSNDIPTEEYAPTALVLNDTIYFMASSNSIYKAIDLKGGKWERAAQLPFGVVDPALFLDDDQRLFLYWGCSDKDPLFGIELDYRNNFQPIGEKHALIYADTANHGWEVPGDYNTLEKNAPWIEGSWMNKYQGKYYLQYAGPGTQFKCYSDGVYVADNPLGPYLLAENNPFSCRPVGFATGAGHGSTFGDKYGNFWHIGTVTISQKHMFERRLALFPTFFDSDGVLHTDTRLGDYPMIIPNSKIADRNEISPGWMLLSYNKPVTVSSKEMGHPKEYLNDEDIRTYWAANSGTDHWAIVDLGRDCDIYALQINFAEHNTNAYGHQVIFHYRYFVEASSDGENWQLIIDQTQNEKDNSHSYIQLESKVNARYVRIQNKEMPSGNFALSGLRVFGLAPGEKPALVSGCVIDRNPGNRRSVHLRWNKSAGAQGYQILFGTAKDKLYQSYAVYGDTAVSINSLNAKQSYYFSIQSFGESGVSDLSSVGKID